jgi:tellurite resistance protein TerA
VPASTGVHAVGVGEARESERRTVLDADDPAVTLRAADLPRAGRLSVVLEWDRPRTRGGVQSSTDVHLGCLWQTVTGHSGVVQSAGGLLSAPGFGARQVLRLGPRSEDEGEPLTVDLTTVDTMRRLLLFASGQRTPPPWEALGVHLSLQLPSGARVLMWPSEPAEPSTSIAIASVHVVEGDLVVRREDEPFAGPAREVALAYGWDLEWAPDGTVPRT